VPPERLRGKDGVEMELAVRRIAAEEARHMIDVTLGEYIPVEGSEISVDFDSAGLVSWAKERFGVEIDAAQIRTGGAAERHEVYNMLCHAAMQRIETADLPRIAEFTEANYGTRKLLDWCRDKFGIELEIQEVLDAIADENRSPNGLILQKADELYTKREVEYPVEFVMQLTMSQARQNPQQALAQLAAWAHRRFGFDWTPEFIQKTPPAQIREKLVEASRTFVRDNVIEREVEAARACKTDEDLESHLADRFGVQLPEPMRFLEPDERPDAIRAYVENLLRGELLYLERSILLQVLDTSWKDHLYSMDQLRDAIGFRSFSQQDPRIEYKREGARLFNDMDKTVRDKVTDFVFKARINPAPVAPAGAQPPRGGPGKAPARAAGGAPIGGSGGNITGPGLA
jgi:preprotein translocase subunit SecA